MKHVFTVIFILIEITLFSCGKVSTPSNEQAVEKKERVVKKKDEKPEKNINNVFVRENGLTVKDLYITREDSSIVSKDNKPKATEKIKLHLHLEGWTVKNGRVRLGASEKITASNGMDILNSNDLFSNVKDFSETGAKHLKLSAKITEPGTFKYYTVSLKVWDKNSNASITGHYQMNM